MLYLRYVSFNWDNLTAIFKIYEHQGDLGYGLGSATVSVPNRYGSDPSDTVPALTEVGPVGRQIYR